MGAPERLRAAAAVPTRARRLRRRSPRAADSRWRCPGARRRPRSFRALARADVDWRRSDFFWSDERAVAGPDPESNYGLGEAPLARAGTRCRRRIVHRLPAELPDLEAAAAAGETELLACLGHPPRLDLLWLGVGEDGHVASLFPGSPLLDERRRHVVAVRDSPKPPAGRLTLTLAAIAAARRVVVTALGRGQGRRRRRGAPRAGSRLPLALALAAADQRLAAARSGRRARPAGSLPSGAARALTTRRIDQAPASEPAPGRRAGARGRRDR